MSFRTVVITKRAKLSYKNRFLVIKRENEEKYIHLSEIDTILVDTLAVSISAFLLKEILDNKINIIFCNDKHNPFGELVSLNSRYNTSKQLQNQISWEEERKISLWNKIVKNKIMNQALVLRKINTEKYEMLLDYIDEVVNGDESNREGHAAKVYFNELFGVGFTRNAGGDINAALNYGYAILLSTINKEIILNGYLTQIGINHKNEFNEFNLTCDLMEPFRPIIDRFVYDNECREFDSAYKLDLVDLFNNYYKYLDKKYTLKDVIKLYVRNTLKVLENNTEYREFIFYEE